MLTNHTVSVFTVFDTRKEYFKSLRSIHSVFISFANSNAVVLSPASQVAREILQST